MLGYFFGRLVEVVKMKEILLDVELITEIHAQGPKEQTQFGFLTTKKLL